MDFLPGWAGRRLHVLLLCEAVTLAHSARIAALARGLALCGHRVTADGVAAIARFDHPAVNWRELQCIAPGRFVDALQPQPAPIWWSATAVR